MESEESKWGSRKLVVCLVVAIVTGAANMIGAMDSLHAAMVIGGVSVTYVGGQALIDAVGKFAAAKFGKNAG